VRRRLHGEPPRWCQESVSLHCCRKIHGAARVAGHLRIEALGAVEMRWMCGDVHPQVQTGVSSHHRADAGRYTRTGHLGAMNPRSAELADRDM